MNLAKHSPTALLRMSLGERAPFEEARCKLCRIAFHVLNVEALEAFKILSDGFERAATATPQDAEDAGAAKTIAATTAATPVALADSRGDDGGGGGGGGGGVSGGDGGSGGDGDDDDGGDKDASESVTSATETKGDDDDEEKSSGSEDSELLLSRVDVSNIPSGASEAVVQRDLPPFLVLNAADDLGLEADGVRFRDLLLRRGVDVEYDIVEASNHMTISWDDSAFGLCRAFIAKVEAGSSA